MTSRRGFTLVELLIGMVLLGIVTTSIYKLLVNNQRLYRLQTQRVDLNGAIRSAALILPDELRELDATGGDVIEMTSTTITYKAMRGAGVACINATATTATLYGSTFGLRSPVATDSILLFAENNPDIRSDDKWLHGYISSVTTGTACPSSGASAAIAMSSNAGTNGVTATTVLGVDAGAPVRYFEVCKLSLYSDGTDYWLGLAIYNNATAAWGSVQPLVGPLTSTGLAFTYVDSLGTTTTDVTKVARIGMTIRGQTNEAVRGSTGAMAKVVDSLVTSVSLRNNIRGPGN